MKSKRATFGFLDSKHYLISRDARWYWFIIALCMLTAAFVLVLPDIYPFVYLRYLLGSALVFCMPGYALVRNLFSREKYQELELVALSVGTSAVLVPMTAFVLNYTPWGIKKAPVTIVLLILTLTLSTLAIFREHRKLSRTQALR